jgi:hypothetical protein
MLGLDPNPDPDPNPNPKTLTLTSLYVVHHGLALFGGRLLKSGMVC